MGVLEEVMQLKEQGLSEDEVVDNLQEQGFQPKQINDAINQANIKNAVNASPEEQAPNPEMTQEQQTSNYAPSTQEMPGDYSEAPQDEQYTQEEYAQQQGQEYAPIASQDSGTMIEIANQIYSEKAKKIQNTIDDLTEFKATTQTKVDSINERLKRMEKIIDTVQIKILEKVGSYGKELEATRKELEMVEDSVGKIASSKHAHTRKHITHKKNSKTKPKRKTKKK